jgi:NitT/TauT family transport system ATP-binding protein
MISIENVDLVYSSRHAQLHALDGISFCASEGEFICIVGPSGCGKSTLLKIVAGLMNPSSGAVRVNGKLLPDMNCSVGIVFQSPLLMPWRTVLQNVMLQSALVLERQLERIMIVRCLTHAKCNG